VDIAASKDADNPANDADLSQWYSACSQGGKTVFPYGDSYDPTGCEYDLGEKLDVMTRAGCRGEAEPYASIHDMSGSVAEMVDECLPWGTAWDCAVRGGSTSASPDEERLSCNVYGTRSQYARDRDLGFRCCKDLH
jgi:formylglycine-generating enzyme